MSGDVTVILKAIEKCDAKAADKLLQVDFVSQIDVLKMLNRCKKQ